MSDPQRRRLVGLRLVCRTDDGQEVPYVEYRLDERGRAVSIMGCDTTAAAMYRRGAAAPCSRYEARVARDLAVRYGVAYEVGRRYGMEDGVGFLVSVLADHRPRTYTWSEAVEADCDGVEDEAATDAAPR